MQDGLPEIQAWIIEGKKVALATVIATERSSPRDAGAALAVSEDGEVVGSVSGGCVEGAVVSEALDVLQTGIPRRLTYGIADEDAFNVGLTCGGIIHLFVERVDW
jgi:xanthine dehydrogenase accessory factor